MRVSTDYANSSNQGRRAIFLDRDGVINAKRGGHRYVTSPAEFHLMPGAIEGLAILKRLGFLLIVITNQRGIAKRVMTEGQLHEIHEFMKAELGQNGIELDHIYACHHEEYEYCACRKPRPGMLWTAARDFGISLSRSYMVGDSPSDVQAAHNAGTRSVRIDGRQDHAAHMTFPSLLAFARFLNLVETCRIRERSQ